MKFIKLSLTEKQLAIVLVALNSCINKTEPNWDELNYYTNDSEEPFVEDIQAVADIVNDKLIGN